MNIVLVFGIPGCGKRDFLRSLNDAGLLTALDLEEVWEELNGRPFSDLLGKAPDEVRRGLSKAIGQLTRDERARVFVGVHATHMVETMLSSPLPLEALKALPVDYCITLHDDLYAVAKRLRDRGWPFTYDQVLLWRNAELLVADLTSTLVARNTELLGETPNFWVGVKHPKSVILKLLREPTSPKVYAAFSISGVREESDPETKQRLKDETTRYRKELYDRGLIVFDPATLDDRLLINRVISDEAPRKEILQIEAHERWPYRVGSEGDYEPAVEDPIGTFPIKLSHAEAFLLRGPAAPPHQPYYDIDAHITQIDLRYVRQADFVTVWRPFSKGVPSVGCYREAKSAVAQDKPVVAFSPLEDEEAYRQASKKKPLMEVWPPAVPLIPEEYRFWREVDSAVKRVREKLRPA